MFSSCQVPLELQVYNIENQNIRISVCTDSDVDIWIQARNLWNRVYLNELGYSPKSGEFPAHQTNSLIFSAFHERELIGTIRTLHSSTLNCEFDYSALTNIAPVFEVSKLIIADEWRSTPLLKLLMMHTQFYCNANYEYSHIVINSSLRLTPFYKRLGFEEIDQKIIIHPIIGNESLLLACPNSEFQSTCEKFEKQLIHLQI